MYVLLNNHELNSWNNVASPACARTRLEILLQIRLDVSSRSSCKDAIRAMRGRINHPVLHIFHELR